MYPFDITYNAVNESPICEALGCQDEATEQIEVSAGKFGTIDLVLCKNCICKFKDTE